MGLDESNIDQYFEAHKKDTFVGKCGTAADISAAIVYLASESFVNGITMAVDGGMSCISISGIHIMSKFNEMSSEWPIAMVFVVKLVESQKQHLLSALK